ncbi:hypothetical protein CR513_03204, partial [Mucuna pruriens]
RVKRLKTSAYQIGAVAGDTSSFVSLCAKTEFKPNPESSSEPLHAFDPEIERTLHRLRKARHIVASDNSSSDSIWNSKNSNFTTDKSISVEYQEAGSMENNDRTLKELATPDVFHGLADEDPHKHLKEFHVVWIPEDHIKVKAFPFSLDGAAKDWLYLQPVLFNTWGDMKRMFLEKFFPASRTTTIRKEICGIRQHSGETLHEYWERFNKLCSTCLMMMDRSMIDATSGGALMDKTPAAARHLISNMASNTQ